MNPDIEVRLLRSGDAESFRDLRLLALQLAPESFGASPDEEGDLAIEQWSARIASGPVFGAFLGARLVGCVGLAQREKRKLRHKAVLWGMFVRPEVRGNGIGRGLLEAALRHADTCFEEVLLTVVQGNQAACQLYASAGFDQYGCEPDVLKIGESYYSEILMRRVTGRR